MSGETGQVQSGWTVDTLKEHVTELVAAHRREVDKTIRDSERFHEALRAGDLSAVDKAFASATKLSEAHNDLLRKMEKLTDSFATKEGLRDAIDAVVEGRREQRHAEKEHAEARFSRLEQWQAKITGGLVVIGAVGLANFVKLWTG